VLETRSPALNASNLDAFRQGRRVLGYAEGQNLVIEYRSSDGRDERFQGLASELVRLNADLILTRGTPAALAAKSATRTTPVVMAASGDPVSDVIAETARSFGIQPHLLDVRRPGDLRGAFDAAVKPRAEALVVGVDGVTQGNLRLIADLVAQQRLPSIYGAKEYVNFGGLMAYGTNDQHMYRRAATVVDRIFKGTKPADLPVEQPTKFELAVNLEAAKALGLTIPQSVLLRADEVIH
jgi:putative ABC transport system substrate-binding protein